MNDMQLRYIVKAVETGSFNKVAEQFGTTYQTVSYQIENLEYECHFEIFKRTNKGCILTDEGEYIYQFAKNTLDNFAAVIRNAKLHDSIRIGVDLRHIPAELFDYASSERHLSISLVPIAYEDLQNKLETKHIDCYFGYERGVTGLSFISLGTDSVGIALSSLSPLSSKECLTFSDINGLKIHIGKFVWSRRDTVIDKIKSSAFIFDSSDTNIESITIAEIYSNHAAAILPCGYSFIFNDNAKVIPLEDETIEYGIYYLSEKSKSEKLASVITKFSIGDES